MAGLATVVTDAPRLAGAPAALLAGAVPPAEHGPLLTIEGLWGAVLSWLTIEGLWGPQLPRLAIGGLRRPELSWLTIEGLWGAELPWLESGLRGSLAGTIIFTERSTCFVLNTAAGEASGEGGSVALGNVVDHFVIITLDPVPCTGSRCGSKRSADKLVSRCAKLTNGNVAEAGGERSLTPGSRRLRSV